jgi:hypothetical protein
VAYEELDSTGMMGELFGEGQGLALQAGHALSQRVVKALDMVGFTGQLADRSMLSSGNHPYIYHVLIGSVNLLSVSVRASSRMRLMPRQPYARHFLPALEASPHLLAVDESREQVPSRAEVSGDGTIGREESLHVAR